MKVLVCGSRGWIDYTAVYSRIGELPPGSIVIHGGARGADLLADQAARAHGFHTAAMYALWRAYGKSAGHHRNRAMLDLEPELVIAFSLGTPGTNGTIGEARRRGIPVEVIEAQVAA